MTVVETLGAQDDLEYEAFLARRPTATLYHSTRYRNLLVAVTGGTANYLVARAHGRIVGVLPVIARDGIYGRVINSLPFFGSYGGVLADDANGAAALWGAFREQILAPEIVAATVIDNPFVLPSEALAQLPSTHRDRRIGQFTMLEGGEIFSEKLLHAIDGSARRNLRKAETAGVRVRVKNDEIAFLEEAHRANMTEIGGTPKPASFFSALPRVLRPDVDYRIYVADVDGSPVAALLLFYFNQFVEYITPATAPRQRELQPMAAILYRALCDAAAEGRRVWNWGGTWLTQTGVYRFKRKWGAQEIGYTYHTILRNPSLLENTPQELSAAYPYFYVVPFSALHSADPVAS